jgi:hypothetical protein
MAIESEAATENFFSKAVRKEIHKDKKEAARLKDLSSGLEWLKRVIDSEREKQIESKLLTLKLVYAGYFGARGRNAKYARNPCAIREAMNFCRENSLPPPDWTLQYIYGLLAGEESLPTESDERRWKNLMRLLDIAAEWDQKIKEGMKDSEIEIHFRRKGFREKALRLAKTFIDPHAKEEMAKFSQKINSLQALGDDSMESMQDELQEEEEDEIEQVAS